MAFAYCPDCGERIYLGRRPWQGQPVLCDNCEADLEVTSVNPLKLDWVDELADTWPSVQDEAWEFEESESLT